MRSAPPPVATFQPASPSAPTDRARVRGVAALPDTAAGSPGDRCYTHPTMPQLLESLAGQIRLITLVDIGLTAVVIYWVFSLIRGTRAVRLVIGVSVILLIYAIAQAIGLRLFTQLLQAGAVVGLFALVVVFQPELRRGLERLGRVGSLAWLASPADQRAADHVAATVARAATRLAAVRSGALIVIERETGLEEIAETGVMIHGDLTADLLEALFAPRAALHDGAVIIRGESIVAAGALLPLAETTLQVERYGTRHRAALGITEQTDAVVVVVSEESGQASLVERARIRRNLDEAQLTRALSALLRPERRGNAIRDRLGRPGPSGGLRRAALGGLGRAARETVPDEPGDDLPDAAAGAGG
jgi:diadenylate cyclase